MLVDGLVRMGDDAGGKALPQGTQLAEQGNTGGTLGSTEGNYGGTEGRSNHLQNS